VERMSRKLLHEKMEGRRRRGRPRTWRKTWGLCRLEGGGRRCGVRNNGGALWGRPKPAPGCNAEE
jgi:hypothetical protein